MTRQNIRNRARIRVRARDALTLTNDEANELVAQGSLDFSAQCGGVWYEHDITLDGSTRILDLPAGYYRTLAVYYRRGTSNNYDGKLAEHDLTDLLDPSYDQYYRAGVPSTFAVTKDSSAPKLYLDTVPASGRLKVFYRGRLKWLPEPVTDDSEPLMLEEFHIGIAYATAAHIASAIGDPEKESANLLLAEREATKYRNTIGNRAGSTGIKAPPSPYRHGRRLGLSGFVAADVDDGPDTTEVGTWYVAAKTSKTFAAIDFIANSATGRHITLPRWSSGTRWIAFARLAAADDPTFFNLGGGSNVIASLEEVSGTVTIGGRTLTVWRVRAAQNTNASGVVAEVY